MAIYEYFCERCNSKFQLEFPFGKPADKASCPTCKNLSKRVYSNFLVFTKGKQSPSSDSSSSRCNTCVTKNCSSCGL